MIFINLNLQKNARKKAKVTKLVVGKVAFENTKEQHQKPVPVKNDANTEKKIKLLESLLAQQVGRSAELLKENLRLEKELEGAQRQRDGWQKLYRKIRPDIKFNYDINNAIVVHGEIDVIKEVMGRQQPRNSVID